MDENFRLPNRARPAPAPPPAPAESVFVPSEQAKERRSQRGWWIGLAVLAIVAIGAVGVMVYWPRLKPKPPDAVEKVAGEYLDALVRNDEETARRLSTVEEPPGIGSHRDVVHQKSRDRRARGSFAPLAALHKRIDKDFTYDPVAGRFTPKNALGIAAETLDALHAAKDEAEKSGMYKKMQSGDPDDIFDAAEQYGKVFDKLSKNTLAPKRLVPTYKMLVESSKPPLPDDAKLLAMIVAEDPKQWDGLLKRSFWTLKPDGPYIYDETEVTATARERLGSLGDAPTRLRLKLVRFRLEGIDTGWKVVSVRRVQPGDEKATPETPKSPPRTYATEPAPADPKSPPRPYETELAPTAPAETAPTEPSTP
jgi:hypothetical protein